MQKKQKKQNRGLHTGMAIKLPFVALQCIFLLCVAAANCSLLFLESLVPFLISPYNRIVNLELNLPPNYYQSVTITRAFCPPDYIFVVYCINTNQLVMRWLLCLSTLNINILFIFHIGCINIQCNIYLFLLVYSIFRDGCFQLPHRATPGQRDVFSEMYMLTGPGWSWRDHADGY